MAKRFASVLVLSLAFGLNTRLARASDIYPHPFYPGEKLTYSVEYMSMEIARVDFYFLDPIDTLGTRLYHVKSEIKSNTRVPILVVHDTYESYFDENCRPYLYRGHGLRRNFAFRFVYRFDPRKGEIHACEYRQNSREEKLVYESHVTSKDRIFDGLTLFYFIRAHLKSLVSYKTVHTQIFINGKTRSVQFTPLKKLYQAKFINQTVASIPLDLRLGFKGIAGLRDRMKFKLSADEKVIPLLGELKVVLGKVRIRLRDYVPGQLPYIQSAEKAAMDAKSNR